MSQTISDKITTNNVETHLEKKKIVKGLELSTAKDVITKKRSKKTKKLFKRLQQLKGV